MDTELFDTLSSFKPASRKHRITDDDFVDRMNRFITPVLICFFSIMICAKQYVVGEPIQCWVPKEFSEPWEEYTENYCWVQNTYYVNPVSSIPGPIRRKEQEIKYYQWVPFVLAIQAALFALPSFIWKALNGSSGMDIKSYVNMSVEASEVDPESRNSNIRMIARHIKSSLTQDFDNEKLQRRGKQVPDLKFGMPILGKFKIFRGSFVSALYIFVKALYLINIIGQFFLLNSFLGTEYKFYGAEMLADLLRGRDWQVSGHFPRVTMCDFEIRYLGQNIKYSIQCVLVINLFNEKVYIFLWFWIIFMCFITVFSLITWITWFAFPSWKYAKIINYLKRLDYGNKKEPGYISYDGSSYHIKEGEPLVSEENQWHKDEFLENILRSDGLFLLRMISNNVGEPIVFDIVTALWQDLTGKKSLEENDNQTENREPTAPVSPSLTRNRKPSSFDGVDDDQASSFI